MITDHFATVTSMIEDLRSDDPEQRLNSVRGFHLIAQTLGPERTKNELIPYVTDYLDDNDEVLRVLANQLGTMISEVGGVQHVSSLFVPLELLCSLDEVTVRDEAVKSFNDLAKVIYREANTDAARQEYFKLIGRLVQSDMPQARCSAASLIALPFANSPAHKAELKQWFQKLCADEEVMVRRSACIALGSQLAAILKESCVEFMQVFSAFCKDKNDSVLIQAIPTAIALMKYLPNHGISQMVTLIKGFAEEQSWRVRYMFADKFGEVCEGLGSTDVQRVCLPLFKTLCSDSGAEIRASVVYNMDRVVAKLPMGSRKEAVTTGCKLVSDKISHVRASLASSILKTAAFTGKDEWNSVIIPACTQLLHDAESDVRLAVVSGFNSVGKTTEAESIAPKLVPVVVQLSEDPKWRVREIVMKQIPSIVANMGKSAEEMLNVCVKCLSDRVACIRSAAGAACVELVRNHGAMWTQQVLFPRISTLRNSTNYLHRVTFLHLIQQIAAVLDDQGLKQLVFPMITAFADDLIANVRMNVVKLIRLVKWKTSDEMTHILKKLSVDKDVDVSDLAKLVLNAKE